MEAKSMGLNFPDCTIWHRVNGPSWRCYHPDGYWHHYIEAPSADHKPVLLDGAWAWGL